MKINQNCWGSLPRSKIISSAPLKYVRAINDHYFARSEQSHLRAKGYRCDMNQRWCRPAQASIPISNASATATIDRTLRAARNGLPSQPLNLSEQRERRTPQNRKH